MNGERKVVRVSAVERRPAMAARAPAPEARLGSAGSGLRQRLGNQGTQAVAAHIVARSSAVAAAPASGIATGSLSISQPGDAHEREAERMADIVMRMPAPASTQSRIPFTTGAPADGAIQRRCAECEEESRALKVQRKETAADTPQVTPAVASRLSALRGGGSPLPAPTREFFEPRFGADFSRVRIHTGAQANEAAQAIGARAFTMGNDIGFSRGQFAPESTEGRHLLAHELTHTLQQGASGLASGANVQRVCEVTRPPADMACPAAVDSAGTGTPIMFSLDSPGLSATALGTLSAIAAAWHQGGGVAVLRLDGFASCEGAADLNWRLSCRRAQTVAAELEAPSDGSPGVDNGHIELFANGETDLFSASSLPPNRRVVITGGGAPPPGPACALTISGPDEVDHYCAAYVPSDAATCGIFPAPDINLAVAGAAAGATLRWNIARGATKASIVGVNTGPAVRIHGDAASAAQGDVTVQVTDGTCTSVHFLTVREPTSMPATTVASSGPAFVQLLVTYTVSDQFGNPMGANICWDETVTTCANSHPGGPHAKGDIGTNASGQVVDQLRIAVATGTLPASLCVKFNQTITAGGCGPLARNTILFQPSGATLNQGASCAAGDPCP